MKKLLSVIAGLAMSSTAQAAVVYNEGTDGALSNDALLPSTVALSVGAHEVIGSVVNPSDTRDYFTFTVAAGTVLEAIEVIDFTAVPTANFSFYGITSGPTSVNPAADPDALLTGDLVGIGDIGADLLEASVAGSTLGSLVPGVYTLLIQQTGSEVNSYHLNFVVVADPIPVPAAGLLFGTGAALVALRRRRQKQA